MSSEFIEVHRKTGREQPAKLTVMGMPVWLVKGRFIPYTFHVFSKDK
jgi:hypothetical protein